MRERRGLDEISISSHGYRPFLGGEAIPPSARNTTRGSKTGWVVDGHSSIVSAIPDGGEKRVLTRGIHQEEISKNEIK